MDGTNPKVSFIPKGSLVREESFLERPRPKSVMGALAVLAFLVSTGSYAGFSFYRNSLEKNILTKTAEIKSTQKEFSDAPQVGRAQVFRSRALLAKELLDGHTLVLPVLSFISDNTLGSILYNNFSFNQGADGAVLELSGEAPNYASLAYQGDVLRKKTKELSSSSIHGVGLTKFGAVSFALTLTFAPGYLSYTKNLDISSPRTTQGSATEGVGPAGGQMVFPVAIPAQVSTTSVSTSTERELASPVIAPPVSAPTSVRATTTSQQPAAGSLWSRFKFW